ncbi:MAG TPA: serine/threonine-protein phosphatase [Propionibacterium sp.]|nr:serine/threonine-protein phosphatase [Propionibacterium sp.]
MGEPRFRVEAGAASDTAGRPHNEDSFTIVAPVFAVADGMGGNQRGDRASALAIEALVALSDRVWLRPEALEDAIHWAGREIGHLGQGRGAPGSTLAGAGLALSGGLPCWLVFNIGDSRVYRLQDGLLEQISVDHSVVQQLLDAGQPDQAAIAPRNLITRALGAGQLVAPPTDRWLLPARIGDRLLICSDGLTGALSDQLISAILLSSASPQAIAEDLVQTAVTAGATDNVTAVVVTATDVWPEPPADDDDLLHTTVPDVEVGL